MLRRGNREAGAIFIVDRGRDGTMALYGPAPQAAYDQGSDDTRRFVLVKKCLDAEELEKWIERQAKFDSDLWIVEVEPGNTPFAGMVCLAADAG